MRLDELDEMSFKGHLADECSLKEYVVAVQGSIHRQQKKQESRPPLNLGFLEIQCGTCDY